MKCKESPYEGLMSWLKFFDIDYLDSSVCNQLSDLDINIPAHCDTAIKLAIRPEFDSLNELSRSSMMQLLHDALSASDKELDPLFERISMPFQSEAVSHQQFLQSIWNAIGE